MSRWRLIGGAPDEPDTGDWDAICDTPGPRRVFVALFEQSGVDPVVPTSTAVSEDETHRVHTIWCGSDRLGVKVIEIASPETTAFPMLCTWETFGLPGLKLIWQYSLEKAGQLGYAAFRHAALICEFDSEADRRRFTELWQQALGKTPVFEPA
ncbi:MAG: hypothetical protein HY060_08320 [Proteobacteria bacterium]|nr:hypothetical protein [Pseudomonadota bacterium]